MILCFDAANTLIHKPLLYDAYINELKKYDIYIEKENLKRNHKILSEIYTFPDQTDQTFYDNFNCELLYSFGVLPKKIVLDRLYSVCAKLSWESFDDVKSIIDLPHKKIILSNFNKTLPKIIHQQFPSVFSKITTSEELGLRKPSLQFYQKVFNSIDIEKEKIIYIGDSLKLDIIPAQKLGVKTLLLDRDDFYPAYQDRIKSLYELSEFII